MCTQIQALPSARSIPGMASGRVVAELMPNTRTTGRTNAPRTLTPYWRSPECPQHRDPHGHRYGLAEAAERRPAEPEGNTEKRHGVEDPAGDRRDGGEAMEPLLPLDQISER